MEIREYHKFDELESSLVEEILRWSDESFGKGYLSSHYLKELIAKAILLVAFNEDTPIGSALLKIESSKEVRPELKHLLKADSKVLYRKFVLVKAEARQRGIAKALHHKIEEEAEKYNLIYTSVWQQEGISDYAQRLLEDSYEKGPVIENYWKEDSISRGFMCAECKIVPCSCSARLYYQLKL